MPDAAPTRVTHARVLAIALPVVLSNATVPLVGLVDTAVVGQLGSADPIAAVGLGALIVGTVYWFFGFLRMGTTGLTAQSVGASDGEETAALLSRALLIGAVGGVAVITLQSPVIWAGFTLSGASEAVEGAAQDYISIRFLSAPAAIATYGIMGWLVGQARTGPVLVTQLLTNGVNIALSAMFVLQFGWGVEGVATASVIAEWSGLALGLWFCRSALTLPAARDRALIMNRDRLSRMAAVNRDILLRTLMLQVIFVSFTLYGTHLGDVTLAANQVLLQFLMVTAFALDGFAYAAEALVGAAIGGRQRDRLLRATSLTAAWCFAIGAVMGLGFVLFGSVAIERMTTAEDVRAVATAHVPWLWIMPILGAGAFLLDGVFIGATRSRDMRNMMAVSLAVYGAAVVALVPLFGNHGLWAALMISFVLRGLTLWALFPRVVADAST